MRLETVTHVILDPEERSGLRRKRKELRISIPALSDTLGIYCCCTALKAGRQPSHCGTLLKWERGERRPTLEHAKAWFAALGLEWKE
jgi:transcriptional regulator with XRE-family HTH domain